MTTCHHLAACHRRTGRVVLVGLEDDRFAACSTALNEPSLPPSQLWDFYDHAGERRLRSFLADIASHEHFEPVRLA